MYMRVHILLIIAFFLFNAEAQTKAGFLNTGIEYNYYPAGHMIGLQSELAILRNSHKEAFANPHHSINLRLGVNIARRKDFSGLNDDERGWGPGISVGYRYYVSKNWRAGYAGLYAGIRTDYWHMNIDWKDAKHNPTSGTTQIGVLQPKIELGYKWPIRQYDIILGLSNGFEINVISKGKDVGQGFISEGQLVIARRLYQ